MNVHELAPGFWFWMAPHPEWEPTENWPEDVLCVYYESSDGIVLIDPLLPRGEKAEFWRALDADVDRLRQPVGVLLTAPGTRAIPLPSSIDTRRASGGLRERAGKGRR